MKFYTSVNRHGNNILYRGYNGDEQEKASIPFSPTMYVPCSQKTGWKSTRGKNLKPINFDTMADANAFINEHSKIDNSSVHGMNNFPVQFVYEKFPNVLEPDLDRINITTIDIEVESEEGFPEPEEALYPILSITIKSNQSPVYYVWGCGEFDVSKALIGEENVRYIKCDSELDLILKFTTFWAQDSVCPDILTGWSSSYFDVPYMINRIRRVMPGDTVKKLSPWGIIKERNALINNRQTQIFTLVGIEHLDYLDLFRKFGVYSYGEQASYKLDHVAYVVLGEKKLSYEEQGNLHSLHKNDYQKFIDYNIRDVELVHRFEYAMNLIQLAMTVAYKGGTNYSDALGTTGLWDAYLYRMLSKENLVPPPKSPAEKESLVGGYVKSPMVGKHDWVVSFDLASLYPHLMMQYNLSPETIVEDRTYGVNIDVCLDRKLPELARTDCCVTANGTHYRKDFRGIIPKAIDSLYSERSEIKAELFKVEKQRQVEDTPELKRIETVYNTQQMAIKIMMNSLYGAMANRYFRYYDNRIAEAVTMSGQLTIRWAERAVNKKMNSILKTDGIDYVIAIDTDSLYIGFEHFVEKLPTKDTQKIVKLLDKASTDIFEPTFHKAYDDLANMMNAYSNKMLMKREVIANRGIWTAKKRYILNVYNKEGVAYKKPKLKVMGIEAVKSSTPQICRDALKAIFEVMLNRDEEDTQKAILAFRQKFSSSPAHEVAFPRGVSNITKWQDPKLVYKKSTPIHVRGSLLYNKQIDDKGLQLEKIKNGEKIKFVYLKLPNHIREDVIAFPDYLPPEFDLDKHIDYEKQFDKTFLAVVRPLLNAMQWSEESKVSIDDFFA